MYVAFKARQAAGVDEVSLWLTTTFPDLDVGRLRVSAARLGVAVDVTVVDEQTAAVMAAEMPGWRSFKDVSAAELAGLVESDGEVPCDQAVAVSDGDGDE
ncbi:hypothetical protein MTQ17_09890 [Corynebacterium bovis]|uniref:hypothetical protein n=1 Tax=Corynebacterium bovis TaxID=36808 RepID=UPI0031389242